MSEINNIFKEVNSLYHNGIGKNKSKSKELRDLFERSLKLKLKLPREEYVNLNTLFGEYVDSYKPEGVKYSGIELIKKLNHFSHDTPDELLDVELESFFVKLNKILEIIFNQENDLFKINSLTETNINLFDKLNKEQRESVQSDSRITLVNSGPGTGKTHLIVHRIIHSGMGDSNKRIIGLSFTNQSSIELRNKLDYEIFGTKYDKIRHKIFTGTIHSFSFDSLKSYHINILKKEFEYEVIDEEEYNEIKMEFNNNKTYILNFLIENKLLTFDNILKDFLWSLRNREGFKEYISSNIQEIVIDESQDLSKIQYEIFYEIFSYSSNINLFLVGDQRQNIFDFLGGNLKNLLDIFDNNSIEEYNLTKSYRCPNKVLEFVNSFTFSDCENVKLVNENNQGEIPVLEECSNKSSESSRIIDLIKNYKSQGSRLSDFVILSPSSFYFDIISSDLNRNNLPFKIFGGETLLDSKIRFLINLNKTIMLKKTYSLLKVISFWDSSLELKNDSFVNILTDLNIMSVLDIDPKLKLSIDFINDSIDTDENQNLISTIKNIIQFFRDKGIFDNESIMFFESFLKVIENNDVFEIEKLISVLSPNNEDFSEFYKKTSNLKYKGEILDDYITLSTIHSSKGKEWDYVILPGLTQDIFPRYNSDVFSEIKKFYVGCTRTKKKLFLFRPISYDIPKKDGFGYWTFSKPKSIFFKNSIPELIKIGKH